LLSFDPLLEALPPIDVSEDYSGMLEVAAMLGSLVDEIGLPTPTDVQNPVKGAISLRL
jgi:hypothetical protein